MKSNLLKTLIKMSKYGVYSFILQGIFCTFALSHNSDAQVRMLDEIDLNVSFNMVSLEETFRKLEKVTDFNFAYLLGELPDCKISLDRQNRTLEQVLMSIAEQSGVSFKRVNKTIHVKRSAEGRPLVESIIRETLQNITVTGRVISGEDDEPIPGVNVILEGTSQGTVTDLDGNFTLDVPDENTILVFSSVGFIEERIKVGNHTYIDMTLMPDITQLEEIVVVGYGTQKVINVTGAVSSIKYDEKLENRPITNASQALAGNATGVWVSQNSGKPGSDGATLRVRGWGTLNNSNPLVIIDGIEGNFEQLNPTDIESISVLKDAASAAIYGSKAANGVILITTKMGKRDEKMQVNLTSYYGVQSLGRRYDMIDNSAEYMELYNQALANEGSNPLFPDYLISAFENGDDPYKYPNSNFFDELFQSSPIQEYNLTFRGGSANTSSFLSFNYLNQDGMVPNTKSQRYGIRANMETDVNKWLSVSGRLNYVRKISKEPYEDISYGSLGRVFAGLYGVVPFTAPYTRDGRFGSVEAIDENGVLLYDNRNPLIDAANGLTTREVNYIVANAIVDVKFSENLNWETTIAATGNWNLTDSYNKSIFGYTDSGLETTTKNYNREGLEINRGQVSTIENNVFSTLNYNKVFAENHDFSAIAGIQMQDQIIKNVYSRRTEAPKEGLTQVDAGTSGIQGEGNMVGLKMFSYFGRANYALSGKYLFEANVRADASSRFAEGNRWGIFPGFSAGWRIINEGFMQESYLFSNLKLRASWGQLGNQNISDYWPYLTVINQNNGLSYSYDGIFSPGAAVTSLVDEDITWETTTTLDIGIDIGFLDDKINIVADYFTKQTEDIIVQLPIPQVLGGLTPPYENVGEMLNTGMEFSFNYNNQKLNRDAFGYDVGVNMTYITNEVTKFRGGDSPDQLYLIREGYSYKTLYGFKAIGIYQTDQEASEHMHSNSYTPVAGNLKFEDINNDGRLGYEDKQDLGNTVPTLTYGLSGNFAFKGFDLNILFQGLAGLNVYTQNEFTNVTVDNPTMTTKWRDAWTPQNTGTDIPSLKLDNSWDNSQSSFWVHEVSFLKLKNIQLGYAFPSDISSRIGVQRIYLFANAQNVFTLVNKDYEGYDPERNTFGSGGNMYPIPRIVSLGLNLNF